MSEKLEQKRKYATMQWLAMLLGVLAMVLAAVIIVLLQRPATIVGNFDQCKSAGGQLSGTASEQCLIGGVSFMKKQSKPKQVENDVNSYLGMAEEAALTKAKEARVLARVVERDGRPLPTTMDFREGRLNLTVADGKVAKVYVEGQATAE